MQKDSELNNSLQGKTVICDARLYCPEAPNCGGTIPHHFDENECCKCPMNKEAKCEEVDND